MTESDLTHFSWEIHIWSKGGFFFFLLSPYRKKVRINFFFGVCKLCQDLPPIVSNMFNQLHMVNGLPLNSTFHCLYGARKPFYHWLLIHPLIRCCQTNWDQLGVQGLSHGHFNMAKSWNQDLNCQPLNHQFALCALPTEPQQTSNSSWL